jgi:PAS domain S-box-containing protein
MAQTHDNWNGADDGYRILFEKLPESMLVFDTSGRITRFNESAHAQLGYSRDEFARLDIRKIDPFETEEGVRTKVRKILSEGIAEFDVKQRAKSGNLKEVHVISRVIPWRGGDAISSIWRDVTQANNLMETLRDKVRQAERGREEAEAIIASIGEAVSVQDVGFRVLYQNRMSRDLVGAHEGEYCYSAYGGRNQVCDGCPVQLSFHDGGTHRAVRSKSTELGTSFFEITASALKDAEGRVLAGIKVVRDVTPRKRAEEELCRRIDALSRAPEELLAAVRKLYASGRKLGLSLVRSFADGAQTPERIPPHEILSPRELQVLRMIASGKTTKLIAQELSLSAKTIATFRSRVLKKMGVTNNSQLTQYALKNRLID